MKNKKKTYVAILLLYFIPNNCQFSDLNLNAGMFFPNSTSECIPVTTTQPYNYADQTQIQPQGQPQIDHQYQPQVQPQQPQINVQPQQTPVTQQTPITQAAPQAAPQSTIYTQPQTQPYPQNYTQAIPTPSQLYNQPLQYSNQISPFNTQPPGTSHFINNCDNTTERDAFKLCVAQSLKSLRSIIENCKEKLGRNAKECCINEECLEEFTNIDGKKEEYRDDDEYRVRRRGRRRKGDFDGRGGEFEEHMRDLCDPDRNSRSLSDFLDFLMDELRRRKDGMREGRLSRSSLNKRRGDRDYDDRDYGDRRDYKDRDVDTEYIPMYEKRKDDRIDDRNECKDPCENNVDPCISRC